MSKFFNSFITDKEEFAKDFYREYLISNTTEMLVHRIRDLDMSYEEVAGKMGKSKGFISQILSGDRNMTLKTLSDISYALGYKVNVGFETAQTSFSSIDDLVEMDAWHSVESELTNEMHIKPGCIVYDKRDESFWHGEEAA